MLFNSLLVLTPTNHSSNLLAHQLNRSKMQTCKCPNCSPNLKTKPLKKTPSPASRYTRSASTTPYSVNCLSMATNISWRTATFSSSNQVNSFTERVNPQHRTYTSSCMALLHARRSNMAHSVASCVLDTRLVKRSSLKMIMLNLLGVNRCVQKSKVASCN